MKNRRTLMPAIMLGLGFGIFGIAVTALAQTGTPPVGMNNPKAPDNNMTAEKNSFSGWMTDYSKAHDGRISRQAYMDESGRRWDAMDSSKQGLTAEQISGMYGHGSMGNNSMNKDNKGK